MMLQTPPFPSQLDSMIAASVARLRRDLEDMLPVMAEPIWQWMRRMADDADPADYIKHPEAFPVVLLPWWLEEALRSDHDLPFQSDLTYSTINGYYFIRFLDNLMDGHATNEAQLLPAEGFFHTRFQGMYQRHFEKSHLFWNAFDKLWLSCMDVTFQDAQAVGLDAEGFRKIASKKVSAAKIPLAAVCYRYDRLDLLTSWAAFCDAFGGWHQMRNDIFSWTKDLSLNTQTYLLAEAVRRKDPDEPVAAWMVREGFDWGMAELDQWMAEARSLARPLDSPPLEAYLLRRRQTLEAKRTELSEGLRSLAAVGKAFRRQVDDIKPAESQNSSALDLFALAQQAFSGFLTEFKSYGIEAQEGLELRRGEGMLCYYDLKDGKIYLSLPNLHDPVGKLYALYLQSLLRLESADELFQMLRIFIPFVVAHELGHHFRHRYGRFGTNLWHEEQVANRLAIAVTKRRLSSADKAFARKVFPRALESLADKVGGPVKAVESYHSLLHALNATGQLGSRTIEDIETIEKLLGVGTEEIIKGADELAGIFAQSLAQREDTIHEINEQYASDFIRYTYYQIAWLNLALTSQETEYVDELARLFLGQELASLPAIRQVQNASTETIMACYAASQQTLPNSSAASHYFYKRYRSLLLSRLGSTSQPLLSVLTKESTRLLAEWGMHQGDLLTYLIGLAPADLQPLFPKRIGNRTDPALDVEAHLPTETDRALWRHVVQDEPDSAAANTLHRLTLLDQSELFCNLPAEAMVELTQGVCMVKLAAGEAIIWEGDLNDDVFVLIKGELDVAVAQHGEMKRVGTIRLGESFGETAFLTGEPRNATVRAPTPSECFVLKATDLRLLAFRHPSILVQMGATAARRVADANARISRLAEG